MEKQFPKNPIFIPKIDDSTIVDSSLKFHAIIMESQDIEWRSKVIKKIAGKISG